MYIMNVIYCIIHVHYNWYNNYIIHVIYKKGPCSAIKHLPLMSAIGMQLLPMWQSNTKHYNFFENIIKFVYETNNTFVTWNTHIYKFEKHLWALIKTVITLYPKRQNTCKNINERNV